MARRNYLDRIILDRWLKIAGVALLVAGGGSSGVSAPAGGARGGVERGRSGPDRRGEHRLAQAAMFCQRVYYSHPGSDAAAKAGPALESLRQTMGESYPPPMAQQMLERGDRWLAAHEYKKGKQEFAALVGQLGGADGEVAAVRIGAADYLARRTEEADQYFQSLKVTSPEADAERVYYEAECARRVDREAAV